MFGFEYALYSFASAIICSLLAKKNNKDTKMKIMAFIFRAYFLRSMQ